MQTNTSTLFQILKPHCVALSEAALDYQRTSFPSQVLYARLDSLLTTLRAISEKRSSEFNPKLAEYVLFPLSHIFRNSQSAPIKLLQTSLQSLSILLQIGWRGHIAPDLAFQLFILLSLLAEGRLDTSRRRDDSEDLQLEAFTCLCHVLEALDTSPNGRQALTDISNVPALGRMVTVVLDGISQSHSTRVSIAALCVLHEFISDVEDREVLASFLPGITSCLTRVSSPTTKSRRSYKVLQNSLEALTQLLRGVLADGHDFPPKKAIKQSNLKEKHDTITLDSAWLSATSAQVKMALASIVKLRSHDRREVRVALQELCRAILEEMALHLSDCIPMMVDTSIGLLQHDNNEKGRAELLLLSHQNSVVGESIRSGLYDRFISLPRLLLSNDHTAKLEVAYYVEISFRVLAETDINLTTLSPLISSSLLESVTSLVEQPKHASLEDSQTNEPQGGITSLEVSDAKNGSLFPEVLTASQNNNDNERMLAGIIETISRGVGAYRLVRESLERSGGETPSARIGCYWLSLSVLRARFLDIADVRGLLRMADTTQEELDLRENLFLESVAILSRLSEFHEHDWRLQALALEGLAFHASTLGKAFRPELADVLYPVLHLLGAGNPILRQHASIALDIIAKACEYQNAQELIVANVDYLVNGVSVRLNMFDVSPEAPQVLLMLVKLCGPSLLPYLDDVTDNIFDGLEHFHGYPTLVELLFPVLRAMVEAGVKSAALTITSDDRQVVSRHAAEQQEPLRMEDLIGAFGLQASRSKDDSLLDASSEAPRRPWNELKQDNDDPSLDDPDDQPSLDDERGPIDTSEKAPPLSRNYHLLHRITTLTQHHLPSSSSSIRSSLLSLLTTALPYLAAHEDTFLPLVHTLWPVLVPRLADCEAYVVSGVLDVIGAMCEGAGDFMRGRVAEIWSEIRRIYRMTARKSNGPGLNSRPLSNPHYQSEARASKEPRRLTRNDELALITHPPSISTHTAAPRAEEEAFTLVSSTRQTSVRDAQGSQEYTPTTLTMVRNALERFLISLVQRVNVSAMIFDEILREMLYSALVGDRRKDVRSALERANADAVWVVLEQARRREEGNRGRDEVLQSGQG